MPWSSNSELATGALEQAGVAVCITDAVLDLPGPRILYVNDAYCRMMRATREAVLGATPRIMQGPLTDRAVLDDLRTKLGAGDPFDGETINYRFDGTAFRISWRVDPVRDREGTVTHFVAWQRDVTEERNNEDRIAATNRIDSVLREILRQPSGRFRDVERLLNAIAVGARQAIAGVGTAVVTVRFGGETFSSTWGAHADSEAPGEVRSFPLTAIDGRFTGAIDVMADGATDFIDTRGLLLVAQRAAASIDALVRVDEQREIAVALQERLLPPLLEDFGGGVAARYVPSTRGALVGGDWYDLIVQDGRAVYVIGDVIGHGVQEAAAMGRIQTAINILVGQGLSIADVLLQVDRFCTQQQVFATCALVERRGEVLEIVSAGHPPPLVISGSTSEFTCVKPSPPLGFGRGVLPATTTTHVHQGDLVVLYTDGLIEVRGETIQDGLDYLLEMTAVLGGATPHQTLEHLLAIRKRETLTDDLAVCVFDVGAHEPR